MNYRSTGLLLCLAMMTLLTSCRKKSGDSVSAPLLLTLHLADHFVASPFRAVIFISDANGKTLADTTVSSDGTYLLTAVNQTLPAVMSVTVANYELYWHGVKVHLNTYTGVQPGSEWTIRGARPDTAGHAILDFVNPPSPPGEILYSTSGYAGLTVSQGPKIVYLYKSPDSAYIRIRNAAGDRYKLIGNLSAGSTDTIDLSGGLPVEKHSISLPMPVENYEAEIYGYKGNQVLTQTPVMCDQLISDGTTLGSVSVDYPPQVFGGFHADLMIQETFSTAVSYFDHTEGNLPSAFTKSEAMVVNMSPGKGYVQFDASGDFSMSTASWAYDGPQFQFFDWNLYSDNSGRTVKLPSVSPAMNRLFPELVIDSLTLQSVELNSFSPAGSYQDFIFRSFSMPLSQRQSTHVESYSVKKSAVQ